jgi:hypothetical protein
MIKTEFVHFDMRRALRVVEDMGCDAVLEQLAKKPSDPTTMQEFMSCFGEPRVADEFLIRYLRKT